MPANWQIGCHFGCKLTDQCGQVDENASSKKSMGG